MWAAIFIDTGVGTIARPTQLDLLESLFSGKAEVRDAVYDYVLAHASAPAGFDWQTIAADFGIDRAALDCFLGWDEPDVVIQGCIDAVRAARVAELPLVFEPAVALTTKVTHRVGDLAVWVTIAAPARP